VVADAPGPVPVARDREGPAAPSEILGALTAGDLEGVGDDVSVLDRARPVPPSVGAGEGLATARAAIGDAPAAWVVRDGRVAGLVTRAALGLPESLAPAD
jgi:cystathionine beta-synthase